MFLKKGKKQPVNVLFRPLQLLTGGIWTRSFRRLGGRQTEVSPVYGTFLGLGILKRRATIRQAC